MLTHVDSQLLASNSQFARLHKDLCKNKLNSDCSTKLIDKKEVNEQEVFANVISMIKTHQFLSINDDRRRYKPLE